MMKRRFFNDNNKIELRIINNKELKIVRLEIIDESINKDNPEFVSFTFDPQGVDFFKFINTLITIENSYK